MKKFGIAVGIAASFVLVAFVCFALGLRSGQLMDFPGEQVRNDSVQAMLAFNRLQDERRWLSLLKKNCLARVTLEIDVARDKD